MKVKSIQMLTACAVAALGVNAAQASVVLPAVELRGGGATTVGDVTVRSLNCIGNPGNQVAGDIANNRLNKYGTNSNQLLTIEPGNYQPAAPTAANPAFNCETQEIQPNFEGKYIGTGSGAGRQMWRTFTTNPPLSGAAGNINPFAGGAGNPSGWANLQFAFSEAPATVSDITAYNAAANNATNKAGAAIQVPFYVIPIAIAYNPVYGVKTTPGGPVQLSFNAKFPQSINGVVSGGIRLNKAAYCGIFNGTITNWNDPALRTLNGNTSLASPSDDAARWASEGVTIQLVGRADRSGGSDVTTRALTAQCGTAASGNKFTRASESLPFDSTSTIDIRRLRPDTRYFPTSAASNFSGSVQSLGGLVYDRVTDNICRWDEVNATTARCDAALAQGAGGAFINARTPGLFLVADGSSGVAEAIEGNGVNSLVTSTVDPSLQLRGLVGYIGADFVKPVPGRTLFSAALQRGTTTAYVMPSTPNATAAFGTVLAPQSTAASGAYNPADPRQFGSVDPYLPIDPATNPATPVSRANPLHWSAVLYNPNVATNLTLANPANGYPITGAAFMLTYTCFKPANPAVPGVNANRFGIVEFMGVSFGKITKNSANQTVAANTFKGTSATAGIGILTQSNTSLPSAGWINAINDTFLKKAVGAAAPLGNLNLWIQDTLPTTAADVDAINQATDSKSNPVCDPNAGA